MDVKSQKIQLAGAVAMTGVAAIALCSATFAWFVNNAKVTATDVNVQAATAYSLLISPESGDDSKWGTTTKLNDTLNTLTPVSTVGEIAEEKITLTKSDKTPVGIGDDTSVEVGDVRFVTNTIWEENYVTGVSEVSKDSTVGTAEDGTNNTYYYKDTVYLKAAQEGSIYLDDTGIGIVWAAWDNGAVSDEKSFYTIDEFMALNVSEDESDEGVEYDANLASAQALLKTMRVGLLVTQGSGEGTEQTWHEYQLVADAISDSNAVNTTLKSDSDADGIVKAVSVGNSVPTNSEPSIAAINNPSGVSMNGYTISDYAITGLQNGVAEATSDADVIAEASVNEEIQVDIYVWMEGCDYDTVAANITSFAGTGVKGLQLGFCLGKVA